MHTTRRSGWTLALAFMCAGMACASTAWVGAGAVRAEEGTHEPEPKAFDCTFKNGTSWGYEGGAFKSKEPMPLAFQITNINLEGQSARLVTDGHEQPGTLKIVRAINANHFLEVVNEGFLNLTTVYDKDAETGLYPAVHSRHFGLLGQPVFAQYAGTCKPE